ncbi:hypothetical protein MMC22_007866 [Lobaria immixta]|nr:hypothetical protein [Lobaria immixta]
MEDNDVEERDIFDKIEASDNKISSPIVKNPQPMSQQYAHSNTVASGTNRDYKECSPK